LLDSLEVLNLRKNFVVSVNGKKKVQKNTGGRLKVQVTIAAFKGLRLSVCFLHKARLTLF